jgi:8-oxo-dGTP pyrophosphatase MutT (NUDIX family)
MEPIPRVSARVLPVSPVGEVLLLQDLDPAVPGVLRWGTIGGAVDHGESLQQAVVREMREETGLVVDPKILTEPFLRSTHDFSWNGTLYRGDNTFFAMPLARDVEISFDHLEPEEVDTVVAWQWWTPTGLAEAGGMVVDDLPEIMAAAVSAVHGAGR